MQLKLDDYEAALQTIQRMLVAMHNVLTEYTLGTFQSPHHLHGHSRCCHAIFIRCHVRS